MRFFSRLSHLCSRGFSENSLHEIPSAVKYPACSDLQDAPAMNKLGCSSSAPAKEVIKAAYCSICMCTKPIVKFLAINGCNHSFCKKCLGFYIASKVAVKEAVICPDPSCRDGILEPLSCKQLINQKLFDCWCDVLCDAAIEEKFYCPFKDCSAVLADERAGDKVELLESTCPHCKRLFCARCAVPWHAGLNCSEFLNGKSLEKCFDVMLENLATTKRWKRCPNCKFYVEKSFGCRLIECRCGCTFCYQCASKVGRCHLDDHRRICNYTAACFH